MNQPAEQFLASAKTAMSDLNEMAATAMAGFEKLVELNMSTAKSALADSAGQLQAGLSAKAPQDLGAAAALAQPMAEKAAAYGRAVAGIVTETGTALTKAAEGKFADVQAQAVAGIEAALKHAPAGSEQAVAAFKQAMSTGQAAMETAQAQAKQAVEAAGKNFAAATDAAVKATKTAGKAR
ncbi:Phasin_2 domain-containing protein [Rubrivivax sp. A210]|uniref:phasin family protein n=1 Tax=Rubrivivax sp. A210 TaxID=2772301 RepID=UPI00191B116A|nr:phasin family protein [Rubrivivax sp. A210]CAD5369661.1 Phasin_2 domain-containing protein [Rubrivivax sp. A210]